MKFFFPNENIIFWILTIFFINLKTLRDKRAAAKKRNMDSDEEPDDVLDNQVGKMSVENDWWRQFIEPQDLRSLLPSNKLRILFEILKLCEQNGEKW